jgi:diphosphoinositol-polyphosphate diphosphatase
MHTPRAVAVSVPLFVPPSLLNESLRAVAATAQDLDIPDDLALLNEPLFLLCTSRKHPDRYVLPKGGIESGESSIEAALREGWVSAISLEQQCL